MSRAEHSTPRRRRVLAGLVPGVLGLALLTACGAGQITQTDTQLSGVNGASGTIGAMAVRNAQLAFPSNAQGVFQPGSSATLIVTIVNTGLTPDTLTKITTPAAESVTIDGSATGTKPIPGNFAVASGQDPDDETSTGGVAVPGQGQSSQTPEAPPTQSGLPTGAGEPGAPATGAPSAPVVTPGESLAPVSSAAPAIPGTVTIKLVGLKSVNGAPLREGLTIPITFFFAHAGQVTLAQVPVSAEADSNS